MGSFTSERPPVIRRWPWRYVEAGGRDLRLDFLRGYALVAMFINHLRGDSWLYVLSGHERFYTSAAEAFYCISGLVLGIVAARRTFATVVQRVLRRTVEIYCAALLIGLGFTALGVLTNLRLWYDLQNDLPRGRALPEFIAGMFTLHTSFHGGEVLVLYVIYMLGAPLALFACAQGKGWLVLVVSGVVYFISQRFPDAVELPFATLPPPAAWQPIFFGALVIGYHRDWLARRLRSVPVRRMLAAAVLLAAAVFVVIHVTEYRLWPGLPEALGEREARMAWPRLALVALYLQSFYLLTTWFWKPLQRGLGWLLIPLGQAALWSFTIHLVVIDLLLNLPGFDLHSGKLRGTLWQILAIMLVWASLQIRRHIRVHPQRVVTAKNV